MPTTYANMSHFNISLEEGVELLMIAAEHAIGREIFAKTTPSYRIMDVAEAVAPGIRTRIVCI